MTLTPDFGVWFFAGAVVIGAAIVFAAREVKDGLGLGAVHSPSEGLPPSAPSRVSAKLSAKLSAGHESARGYHTPAEPVLYTPEMTEGSEALRREVETMTADILGKQLR